MKSQSDTLSSLCKRLEHQSINIHIDGNSVRKMKSSYTTYLKYHRQVSILRKAWNSGKNVSESFQKKAIKNSLKGEKGIRKCLIESFNLFHQNKKSFKIIQREISKNFNAIYIFSNPAYLGKEVRDEL